MKRVLPFTLTLLVASGAFAQEPPDAGAPASSSLADELDLAAGTPSKAAPVVPPQSPVSRAFQSLNPDISVIADVTAGLARGPSYSTAGDDPVLSHAVGELPAGLTAQEVEIGFQSVVDPYFKAELYLTIPNQSGLEVEEAVVTTTSLPANLQARTGLFRSAFGRNNGQHLHVQEFTRRPLVNEAYLGVDGLRAPGAQLSWLVPAPFFLQLSGEVFAVGAPEGSPHLSTFGGTPASSKGASAAGPSLTGTAELKAFFPATESLSVSAGLNVARGTSPGLGCVPGPVVLCLDVALPSPSTLGAFDLYVKYKPPNVAGGYFALAWTTEVFVRQLDGPPTLPLSGTPGPDGGLYTQLVAQVARRWLVGLREDLLGTPSTGYMPRTQRTSLSVTYLFSEFARLRAYGERETTAPPGLGFFSGPPVSAAYLQLEVSMGAHGAHAF